MNLSPQLIIHIVGLAIFFGAVTSNEVEVEADGTWIHVIQSAYDLCVNITRNGRAVGATESLRVEHDDDDVVIFEQDVEFHLDRNELRRNLVEPGQFDQISRRHGVA